MRPTRPLRLPALLLTLSLPLALFVAGCAGEPIYVNEGPGGPGGPTPGGTPASFAGSVTPIFTAKNCDGAGCHSGASPAGNLLLGGSAVTAGQVYSAVMAGGASQAAGTGMDVNTANPPASLLVTKPTPGTQIQHTGGKLFASTSDPDYLTILSWIQGGALNN